MHKCIIAVEEDPRVQFTIEADPNNMPEMIILISALLIFTIILVKLRIIRATRN